MQNYKSILFFVLLLATQNACSTSHEFDLMCQIFNEASNTSLSRLEKSQYIFENIDRRISSKIVNDVFTGVLTLDPEVRYDLIKEAAELELKRDWECSSMQILMKPNTDTNQ